MAARPAGAAAHRLPAPAFMQLDGFATGDAKRLNVAARAPCRRAAGSRVQSSRTSAASPGWIATRPSPGGSVNDAARGLGLLVRGRVKPYAPPFMMLGVNLENTTSSDFRITATARYLAFDMVGSGSELRIDGTLGSDPSLGDRALPPDRPDAALRRAIRGRWTHDIRPDCRRCGRCALQTERGAARTECRCEPGAHSDVRIGSYIGRYDRVRRGRDPAFPELHGKETVGDLAGGWIRRIVRSFQRVEWRPACDSRTCSAVPISTLRGERWTSTRG